MPNNDPHPRDPQLVIGAFLPGKPETMREMAEVFADEFARIGYSAPKILALFENPFFTGAHAALRVLGELAVCKIIAQAVVRWPTTRVAPTPPSTG